MGIVRSNLADVLQEQGEHERAAELHRALLATGLAHLPPDDLALQLARQELAWDLEQLGRRDEIPELGGQALRGYLQHVHGAERSLSPRAKAAGR